MVLERYYGLGNGCSRHRMQWYMNFILVWVWVLWSSAAVEHERYHGLSMDALVTGCLEIDGRGADALLHSAHIWP